jgi:hypothetical protein
MFSEIKTASPGILLYNSTLYHPLLRSFYVSAGSTALSHISFSMRWSPNILVQCTAVNIR